MIRPCRARSSRRSCGWRPRALTAPPATAVIRSGPLTAGVGGQRWALTFDQAHGGPALREVAGGGGAGPGRLGFRTAGGWRQATRVLSRRPDGRALALRLATDDPAGRRLSVLLRPAGDGVIALTPRSRGAQRGVQAVGDRLRRAARRALPRLRRALERRRPARADGRELRLGRAVPAEDRPFDRARSSRRRASAPATTPPTSRSRGCCRAAGSASSSTTTRPATSASATRRGRRAGASRSPAPAARRCAVFAGPDAGRRAAALHRARPAASRAPAAPWVFGPWFQTGQPNATPLATSSRPAEAAGRRRAGVGRRRPHCTTCRAGDQRREEHERERVAAYHAAGLAVPTYVNPMLCTSYEPRSTSGRGRRRAAARRRAGGRYVRLARRRHRPGGFTIQPWPVRLLARRRPRASTRGLLDEAVARRPRRLDGGLRRVHAARRALGRRHAPATALHNRYPARYHCAAHDAARRGAAPVVRFQRSGWTGAARCADDRLGRRPDHDLRLRRPELGGQAGAQHRAVRASAAGARTSAATTRSARDRSSRPSCSSAGSQLGAVSGVMRTKADGIAIPSYDAPAGLGPGDDRRSGGATRSCTPSSTRTSLAADASYRRTGLPLMRALVLALPATTGARRRATTSSCSAPTCSRRPCSRRARSARACTCRAAAGSTVARRVALRRGGDGALPRCGARGRARRADVTLPGRRSTSCRCSSAPAPSCRCCPPTSTRLSDYGAGAGRAAARPARPAAPARVPAAAQPAGMFGASASRHVSARGVWTLAIRGDAHAPLRARGLDGGPARVGGRRVPALQRASRRARSARRGSLERAPACSREVQRPPGDARRA